MQKPKATLRKGERDLGRAHHRLKRCPGRLSVAQPLSKAGNSGGFKHVADAKLYAERSADATYQARSQRE